MKINRDVEGRAALYTREQAVAEENMNDMPDTSSAEEEAQQEEDFSVD